MKYDEENQTIWNLISELQVGMLTTFDGQRMHSRPMYLVQDSYDGILWFFAHIGSEKTKNIFYQENVCVTFNDPHTGVQVSISGDAKLNLDRTLINRFWSPMIERWLPGGRDDAKLGVLEVSVKHTEYWGKASKKTRHPITHMSAGIVCEKYDTGRRTKFN